MLREEWRGEAESWSLMIQTTSNILCFSLGMKEEDMREHNKRKDDGLMIRDETREERQSHGQ